MSYILNMLKMNVEFQPQLIDFIKALDTYMQKVNFITFNISLKVRPQIYYEQKKKKDQYSNFQEIFHLNIIRLI